MAKWNNVNTGALFPKELQKVSRALGTASTVFGAALKSVEAALHIAKAFAVQAATNPVEIALRKALDEIEQFLLGVNVATTAHALMIPIQKTYQGESGLNPLSDVSLGAWIKHSSDEHPLKANLPTTLTFVNDAPGARGGNQGYWREFVSSLHDPGDLARPWFPENYAVVGTAILMGEADLSKLFARLSAYQALLHFGVRADMMANMLPVVPRLRARILPIPATKTLGVQLQWDPVPTVQLHTLFTTDATRVKEIFVIRSTSPRFRERFSWLLNFPKDIYEDDTATAVPEGDYETRVIARLHNDGFLNAYVDTLPLEEGQTYYYALSLRYEIKDVPQPMGPLSNVERIRYLPYCTTTRQSTPPDWYATPSLIRLFPALQSLVNQARMQIAKLLTRTSSNSGPAQLILRLITQVQRLVRDIARINQQFARTEAMLRAGTSRAHTGVYATTIALEKGGIQAWARELAARLSDPDDPSRPPYDNQEFTAGFVILAGAPHWPELQAFRKLLEAFFGGGKDANPLRDVVMLFDRHQEKGLTALQGFDTRLRPVHENVTATMAATDPGDLTDMDEVTGLVDTLLSPDEENDAVKRKEAAVVTPAPPKTSIVFDATMTPSRRAENC